MNLWGFLSTLSQFPGNSVPMATSVTDTLAGSWATASDGQIKLRIMSAGGIYIV